MPRRLRGGRHRLRTSRARSSPAGSVVRVHAELEGPPPTGPRPRGSRRAHAPPGCRARWAARRRAPVRRVAREPRNAISVGRHVLREPPRPLPRSVRALASRRLVPLPGPGPRTRPRPRVNCVGAHSWRSPATSSQPWLALESWPARSSCNHQTLLGPGGQPTSSYRRARSCVRRAGSARCPRSRAIRTRQ
jgi:hypothetical protein